jgi:hypothetical protein
VAEAAQRRVLADEVVLAAERQQRAQLRGGVVARARRARPVVLRADPRDVEGVLAQALDEQGRRVEQVLEARELVAPVRAGALVAGQRLHPQHRVARGQVGGVRGRLAGLAQPLVEGARHGGRG